MSQRAFSILTNTSDNPERAEIRRPPTDRRPSRHVLPRLGLPISASMRRLQHACEVLAHLPCPASRALLCPATGLADVARCTFPGLNHKARRWSITTPGTHARPQVPRLHPRRSLEFTRSCISIQRLNDSAASLRTDGRTGTATRRRLSVVRVRHAAEAKRKKVHWALGCDQAVD